MIALYTPLLPWDRWLEGTGKGQPAGAGGGRETIRELSSVPRIVGSGVADG